MYFMCRHSGSSQLEKTWAGFAGSAAHSAEARWTRPGRWCAHTAASPWSSPKELALTHPNAPSHPRPEDLISRKQEPWTTIMKCLAFLF